MEGLNNRGPDFGKILLSEQVNTPFTCKVGSGGWIEGTSCQQIIPEFQVGPREHFRVLSLHLSMHIDLVADLVKIFGFDVGGTNLNSNASNLH